MEIEMFFAKYDTDGSRLLEQDEVRKMLADLEGQKVELESKSTCIIDIDKVCLNKLLSANVKLVLLLLLVVVVQVVRMSDSLT